MKFCSLADRSENILFMGAHEKITKSCNNPFANSRIYITIINMKSTALRLIYAVTVELPFGLAGFR